MKTYKSLFTTCALLLNFVGTGFGQSISTEASTKASTDELISSNQAKQNFKGYINKQIAKHNLKFSQEQIDNLLTKGYKLIYENIHDGQITNAGLCKIQKDLKIYLKTNYPDNYKPKRSKNEVNYKLARSRIRAITKDFAINTLKAKNKPEILEHWNKVKDMVCKKLDKAAYFNDYNELVVDETAIAQIIGKVFEKLSSNEANGQNSSNNPGNHKRKRKALTPSKISAPIAEKLVRLMIRNNGITAKYSDQLVTKIMKKINKKLDKKGKIEKTIVVEIAKKEIETFKNLKNTVIKKQSQRYIDRFIDAMGTTPETDVN